MSIQRARSWTDDKTKLLLVALGAHLTSVENIPADAKMQLDLTDIPEVWDKMKEIMRAELDEEFAEKQAAEVSITTLDALIDAVFGPDTVKEVHVIKADGVPRKFDDPSRPGWRKNMPDKVVSATTKESVADKAVGEAPAAEKPPIGLRPEDIYRRASNAARCDEIFEAMRRYTAANKAVPVEWLSELQSRSWTPKT